MYGKLRHLRGQLVAVPLMLLPLTLFWIMYTRRAEQIGPLANGTDLSSVGEAVYLLAFDRDGQTLWSFTLRDAEQWNISTKRKLRTHPLGAQLSSPPPSPPSLSGDAATVLTADRDARDCFYVKLWDVQTGQLKRSLCVSGSMEYQRNAALSPNGILATHNWGPPGGHTEQIKIWNIKRGALLTLIQVPGLTSRESTTISCLALSKDGTLVVAGSQEGDIFVWDARSGQQLGKWRDGSANILLSKSANSSFSVVPGVYQVVLSPRAEVLATASGDDTVRLWQPRTGKLVHILRTPTGQSQPPLLFSPNGKWLASAGTRDRASYMGSANTDGRVWDVQTGVLHARLKGDGAKIKAFAFSPDSTVLASGDEGGAIKLWSLK